jgi:hypothetical protein
MKFLKLFLTAVVSFLIPSVAAQQRSSASHLGTVNAPLSAKSISITGLAEMYEPDFMGSSASGDGFSYHDIWPDVGWWATCIIGQPCQVPSVRLSTEWPDQQGGESACFDTCTSFRTGEIDFGEPFITPATNSHVSVQVPVTVYGSVTGYYSTDEFSPNGWPLWTVTFRGKGTANVSLVYWSENTLVIDSFSVRYTAATSTNPSRVHLGP